MSLINRVKKMKSRNFLEATVAGCAMVAFANGLVKPEEIAKMFHYIQIDETLQVYDLDQAMELFDKYVQDFEFDIRIGREKALRAITKIRNSSDEARLLVLVCCAIGSADDDFDPGEKKVVRDICRHLSLDPNEFGLFVKSQSSNLHRIYRRAALDDRIPDWMKNPPKHPPAIKPVRPGPKPTNTSNAPKWMRNPPPLPRQAKKKAEPPKWMMKPISRQKPISKTSGKKDEIPRWMNKPINKPQQRCGAKDKDDSVPDWMK